MASSDGALTDHNAQDLQQGHAAGVLSHEWCYRMNSVDWWRCACAALITASWISSLAAGLQPSLIYLLPLTILGVVTGVTCILALLTDRQWAILAFLGFVVIVPALSFRSREIGTIGLDWQNGIKLVLWFLLLGICIVKIRSYGDLLKDSVILGFLSFISFGLISSLYSPVPLYSAVCALGVAGYLLFACFIAANVAERTILRTLTFCMAGYFLATWLYALLFPDQAFLPPYGDREIYRLFGLSSHPNMLAVEVSCLLCIMLTAVSRGHLSKKWAWAIGLLAAITILNTGSRTSALALVLAAAAAQIRARGWGLPFLVLISVCGVAFALAAGLGLMPGLDELVSPASRTGDAGEILTMTGRTELWSFVWDTIMRRPFFGYGFNSAEAVLAQNWYGNPDAGYNAHNTFLQALLTVGFVGTFPLIAAYVILVYRWFARRQSLASYVTPYLTIVGITEVHIASNPFLLTLVAFLAIALDALALQNSRSVSRSASHINRAAGPNRLMAGDPAGT
ncbi:O-antigen ligase family protein [Microvirga sp. M2]|uniref:O-antigen ligase family protein n=1 Tax=Microvirga sp. M2 TaxID=3073270 RepID=UPI0039C40F60